MVTCLQRRPRVRGAQRDGRLTGNVKRVAVPSSTRDGLRSLVILEDLGGRLYWKRGLTKTRSFRGDYKEAYQTRWHPKGWGAGNPGLMIN